MIHKFVHLLSNIVCGVIPSKHVRDVVRTCIRYSPEIHQYKKFVREYAKQHKIPHKYKILVGYGCFNVIFLLNKNIVLKCPLRSGGNERSLREKRIVDTFRKTSPIKIPNIELIHWKNIIIRKYEFADGKLLTDFTPKDIQSHRKSIAKEIANFLYIIGKQDPKELQDLKPQQNVKPGYLYGWCQNDIWQNFMLDPKTFHIKWFIDWEQTDFNDFSGCLYVASHNWDKFGYKYIIVDIITEYTKLYYKDFCPTK